MAAPITVPATPRRAPITAEVIAARAPPTSWIAEMSRSFVRSGGGAGVASRIKVLVSVMVLRGVLGSGRELDARGNGDRGMRTPLSTPPNAQDPRFVTAGEQPHTRTEVSPNASTPRP